MDFQAVSPLCAPSLVGCHADIVPVVRGREGSYDQQGPILQHREPRLGPGQLPPVPQPFDGRLGNTCKEKGKRPQTFRSAQNKIDSNNSCCLLKSCWKDNTWGGQELPRGSPSCYRMILTLKIFILNIVKSLLASDDFPQDFHTQWLFKSLLVWIFPYKAYMENTVWIGQFCSSL